jgi:hypothetical protein
VRYRTAAIVSAVPVVVAGAMFGLQYVVLAAYRPSLEQGLPISDYERILFKVVSFCVIFKWFLALLTLPTIVVLFTIAVFTSDSRAGETATLKPPPIGRPPALWNPKAAACWSLLFSPVFGAFLHARNADALGRVGEAKANRIWFYILIAYIGFDFATIFIFIPIPRGLFDLVPTVLLFVWYLSLGKKQVAYVKGTWRDGYERKSWKEPLLIAFGFLIGASIVFAVAADLMSRSQ